MAGWSRKKPAAIVKPSQVNSNINVTPLVDVVLVLLIIFMVVTPLLEKEIAMQVPESDETDQPDEVPPDQVIVSLTKTGAIEINGNPVEPDDYASRLEKQLNISKQETVFIVSDDAAPYPRLVTVLDGARRAGAVTLAMAPEPEE